MYRSPGGHYGLTEGEESERSSRRESRFASQKRADLELPQFSDAVLQKAHQADLEDESDDKLKA